MQPDVVRKQDKNPQILTKREGHICTTLDSQALVRCFYKYQCDSFAHPTSLPRSWALLPALQVPYSLAGPV